MIGVEILRAALMISLMRGTPSVTFIDATPAKWNVFSVICVPGSPIDCAPTAPTAEPGSICLHRYLCMQTAKKCSICARDSCCLRRWCTVVLLLAARSPARRPPPRPPSSPPSARRVRLPAAALPCRWPCRPVPPHLARGRRRRPAASALHGGASVTACSPACSARLST